MGGHLSPTRWLGLSVVIFHLVEESRHWPMQRGRPGFLAAGSLASDDQMTATDGLGRRARARLPGDADRAWFPGVTQAAFGRPWDAGHAVIRTYFRSTLKTIRRVRSGDQERRAWRTIGGCTRRRWPGR